MLQQFIPIILQKLGDKLASSVAEWTAKRLLPQQMVMAREISEQLRTQENQFVTARLQNEAQFASQDLALKSQALALQQVSIEDKRILGNLYLEAMQQRTLAEIQMRDKALQAGYDQGRWASVLSREEVKLIFGNEQVQHRLLMLVPMPDISEELPVSFRDGLKKELRNQLKSFMEKYFSLENAACPVEFYGKYFERAVFDAEIRQLESILPVPTAIIYTDITDHEVYVNVRLNGLNKGLSFASDAWDWEQARVVLQQQGMDEIHSLRQVRELIVNLHQVFAAFLADWYYLNINPLYEPRLLQPEVVADLPAEWVQSCVEKLRPVQTAYREAYLIELQKLTLQEQQLGTEVSFTCVNIDNCGKEIKRTLGKNFQKVFDLGRDIILEMVYIPAGEFWMGSPGGEGEADEKPQHKVCIAQGFYLGKVPITQAQYEVITGKNPSSFKGRNRPVENISWRDAQQFCRQLSRIVGVSLSLPSESQWEYACRAGSRTTFYFGDALTAELANYDATQAYAQAAAGKYRQQTTEVAAFPPNTWGLCDMHGNVREWCADSWHDNYQGATTDGSAWVTAGESHLLRGGSWDDYADACRSAYRSYGESATAAENTYGLRVVLVP
jgi:formylglycine-generating enzyme required for sulfatase activity